MSKKLYLASDMTQLPAEAVYDPAYDAFLEEMKGKSYGSSALNTAWSWFKAGFKAQPMHKVIDHVLIESVKKAAVGMDRLCMQGWVREQIDRCWGDGITKKYLTELHKAIAALK